MSKKKFGFSLILTLVLVGILSITAFARGAYWESISKSGDGFKFSFINTDSTAKDFTVNVYSKADNYTAVVGTQTITGAPSVPSPDKTTPYNNATFASADLTGGVVTGTIYKFELTDSTGVVGVKYGVITDSGNLVMASIADDSNLVAATGKGLDVEGSGLSNANHTGMNENAKKPNQKTHGFYQNNTNSCAGCHQTHTAADGEYLLFKDGIYSTCSACHDGTTGAYNSFAPATAATTASISGTFDVHGTNQNGSLHQADGSLKISAAPGGNMGVVSKNYDQEFNCASCHAPHGAGSNDENNLNTDPMGWGSVPYLASGESVTLMVGHSNKTFTYNSDSANGKLFVDAKIVDQTLATPEAIPTTFVEPYILVKTKATTNDVNNADPTKNNYFWKRAGVQVGDYVIQTYRWTPSGGYVKDYSLWNRELGYPYLANTALKDASDNDLSKDTTKAMKVVWRDGFAFGADVANVVKANVSLGIDVETTSNIQSLYNSSFVVKDASGNTVADESYIPDSGTEMSKYCASCHVDYASNTRGDMTGNYTQAHRHATLQDRLTCVRCHYGHGSEAKIMHDANDNTYFDLTTTGVTDHNGNNVILTDTQATDYLKDVNPSSALKRYTGMAVCFSCHGKGQQFLGNGQGMLDGTTGQYLMDGEPGTTHTVITK